MKVNFIGLDLDNSYWSSLKTAMADSGLFEWVDMNSLHKNTKGTMIDPNPHITLAYSHEFEKGPNWFNYFLTIKNRDLYDQLRSFDSVKVSDVKIKYFNNPESKPLVIPMLNCNVIEIISRYSDTLYKLTPKGESDYGGTYKPHVTITYLKPNTPDEIIDNFEKRVLLSNLKSFDIKGFLIGLEGEDKTYRIPIKPKE